ncbi:MAG: hypothetical protein AB7F89_12760 [Pirellulaceae bacterium]
MIIGKNQNTYAKRKREMDKKAKAQAKRQRRDQRKLQGDAGPAPDQGTSQEQDGSASPSDESNVSG